MPSTEKFVAGFDEVFLKEAAICLDRCRRASEEGNSDQEAGAAASTFVMCCAAVEAFVSERRAYLHRDGQLSDTQAEDIKEKKGAHSKLHKLVGCIGGQELYEHPDYHTFSCVVRLRNTVVHRNAEYLDTETWPGEMSGCEGVVDHVEGDGLDWTSQVLTPKTAEWAIRATRSILDVAEDQVPNPRSETILNVGIGSAEAEALSATVEESDGEED